MYKAFTKIFEEENNSMNVQSIKETTIPYYGVSKEERREKTSVAINEKDVMKADGGVVYESSRFDGGLIVSVEGASVRSTTSNQQLQSRLSSLGFYNGPINGDLSTDLSKKAITNFQKVYGLTANGVVDNTMTNKLNEVNTMYSKLSTSTALTNLASSSKLNLDSTEKQNLAKIWTFFRLGMGLTKNQAAGVCGNLYAESKFSPNNAQDSSYPGDHNSNYQFSVSDSVGYGLEQWTEESVKTTLKNTASGMGLQVSDLNAQLATFRKEIESTRTPEWKKVLANSSYSEVSDTFLEQIEKPTYYNYAERRAYSKEIYSALSAF